jgi:Domain of unknown function (DUF4294)
MAFLGMTGGFAASAQTAEYGPRDTVVVFATLMPDGTLVPTSVLPDVEVVGKMPRWMAKKMRSWTRLRNAVYVTYPYAKEAGRVINDINRQLAALEKESDRKQLIKTREQEIKNSFADRIVNLSVYQGKVLMKLINRETGNDCYNLLKEYKGGINARMWQTVAFFFGSNLKQSYDPRGEDAEIESIVQEVKLLYYKG